MEEGTVAEAVTRTLAERGWTLGMVECGTGGIVSHRLFETEDGPAVLGDSLNVGTVEEAVDFLQLPWQQFGKSGDFSAKAARAAARAGRGLLEVDWCLVVWARPLPDSAVAAHETVHLALDTIATVVDQTIAYDGPAEEMAGWLEHQTMLFLNEALAP
jgi:nicotinamide mononucleotide (NMN) deamidase PncC